MKTGDGGGAMSRHILLVGMGLALAACNPETLSMPIEPPVISGETPVVTGASAYLTARYARSIRDHSAAADFLAVAIEADPDNPRLIRRAYLHSLNAGRYAESLGLAERMLEVAPDAVEGRLRMAVEAIRAGDLDAAMDHVDRIESRSAAHFAGPLLAAWIETAQGDLAGARKTLEPIGRNAALAPLYHLHGGLMAELAGDDKTAGEAYEPLLPEIGRLPARLGEIVGSYLERQDRREAARAVYTTMLENRPGSLILEGVMQRFASGAPPPVFVRSGQDGVAEALYQFATALQQDQALDTALSFVRLSLLLRPDDAMALMVAGNLLEAERRPVEAIITYEQIDVSTPQSWVARLRAALAYEDLELTDVAIEKLRAMAEERPDRIDALVQLGNVLRTSERFAEAVDVYDAAMDRVEAVKQHHWDLFYNRGIALERSKRWDPAEKDFLKALELEPDQPYVLNYLGYSWIDQGKHLERARQMIERAVELRPNDGYIVDSLGWAFYRLGEYEQAVRQLERAVELRPQDPVINDHLGDALWQVGREFEARFQWRRALSLEPEASLIETIETKLREGLAREDDEPPVRPITSGAEREG